MSQLDSKEYENEVVRPLRGRSGRLPDDLLTRYAVDLGMSDEQLCARLDEVRSLWNKGLQSRTKPAHLRAVYKQFLRADEELRNEYGEQLSRISWWRRREAEREEPLREHVAELAAELRENFGHLGLIAPAQLESYRDTFSDLPPAKIDEALRVAEVQVAEPVPLPRESGMRHYDRFRRLLEEAQVAGVPQLLHEGIEQFWLLDGFAARPPAPEGLTAEAARSAVERAERRTGTRERREALGILTTAVEEGLDLRELALYELVADVRHHREKRGPTGLLLRRLEAVGLNGGEARRLVVGVLAENSDRGSASVPRIRALLEQGLLGEARRALGGVEDGAEAAEADRLVRDQVERVQGLREEAERAISAGAHDEARRRLRKAVELASDDAGLTAQLHRVPPPPVLTVSAQPEGVGVRLSWRPSPEDDDVRYRVVRQRGRVPTDPDDGEVVEETAEPCAQDEEPPAGVPLGYGVFAVTDGQARSEVVGTSVEILPPVVAVGLVSGDRAIEGQWRVHPDVLDVDVRREEEGRRQPVALSATRTSFIDTSAEGETPRTYVLTARYRKPDGTLACADPVRVRGSVRESAEVPPVAELGAQRRGDRLVLSWAWPAEVAVAEVDWSGSTSGRMRVTRHEYQEQGGCRIDVGNGAVRVRVRGVCTGRGRSGFSPPAAVDVAGGAPRIRYSVERKLRPLVGGGTVRIRCVADQDVRCTLAVVARQGRVMPEGPDEGRVLHREPCELNAQDPLEVSVELPRLKRPFWIRCFAEDTTAQLVPPATSDMKVS